MTNGRREETILELSSPLLKQVRAATPCVSTIAVAPHACRAMAALVVERLQPPTGAGGSFFFGRVRPGAG